MLTKDLIKKLQELDPDGNKEVVVGCEDIHFLESLPMYYDGRPILLKRDLSRSGYNIVGARVGDFTGNGKIQIHTLSLEELFYDEIDLPVEYSNPSDQQYIKSGIEQIRNKIKMERLFT